MRFRPQQLLLKFGLGAVFLAIAGAASAADVYVADVRVGAHTDKTRLVFDLSGPLAFDYGISPTGDSIYIDLKGGHWASAPFSARHSRGAIVEFKQQKTRDGISVSVLTDGPVQVRKPFLIGPSGGKGHRLVFDLIPMQPTQLAEAAPVPLREPRVRAAVNLPQRSEPAPQPAPMEVASTVGGYAPPPDYRFRQQAQTQQPIPQSPPPAVFPQQQMQPQAPGRTSFLGFDDLYFRATAGANFLTNVDSEGAGNNNSLESDIGWSLGGAAGIDLNNGFRVEGELFYSSTSLSSLNGTANGSTFNSGDVDGDVSALALMGNVAYDYENQSRFTPFFFGGVGLGRVSFNDISVNGTQVVDDSNWAFAIQGGAGISLPIDEFTTLEAYYRYFEIVEPELASINNSPFETEYASHDFIAGVRIKF